MPNYRVLPMSMLSIMSLIGVANASDQNSTAIMQPINALFDGMRNHDNAKILQQFTDSAQLQRATKDGQIRSTDIQKFADNISQHKAFLDEQLLQTVVLQQDNLASVWTPFAFYIDGKLSHCGSNSFQLIKQNEQWKIHFLIDVSHDGDCQEFILKHKSN
jgi:hypothetical protein